MVGELRKSDTVARQGGNEFVIVSLGANASDSQELISNKLLEAISQPYHFSGLDLNLTCSIGIALFPYHGVDSDALIQTADQATYAAKRAGKSMFRIHQNSKVDTNVKIED